jgi:hypothetical protein
VQLFRDAVRGDFNFDRVTDVSDFDIWLDAYNGSTPPTAVPEPATGVLLLGVALAMLQRLRTQVCGHNLAQR